MALIHSDLDLIFHNPSDRKKGYRFPKSEVPSAEFPQSLSRKDKAQLPETSELDVVRHFTNLSHRNFSVDTHFYPLGSCTMKYNPKAAEDAASLPGFTELHPWTPFLPGGEEASQGALAVIHELGKTLAEAVGMDEVTCQPLAGAHGEMTGIMLVAAYHRTKGNRRKTVIVPDSSHGTNPASAAMAGYEIVTIPTAPYGDMDLDAFRAAMNDDVAAVMMTCPNTLGLFNPHIREIADIAHQYGALMYYDGANFNAILGKVRPGDVGFDVVHMNVHKTFGTPHGGGGPGAGPVGVKRSLVPFLPVPRVVKKSDGKYALETNRKDSIGSVANFFGNFGVLLRAYYYILANGREGLVRVSEMAVLNANYIMSRLKPYYDLPFDKTCMHECVFSASRQVKQGVHAIDIAKALIERGFHPPTVYFPMIVKEAVMIEPTETESKETLDEFIDAMIEIAKLAETDPASFAEMPSGMPVRRPDETRAAREIRVTCLG
jgi:glycine dehydrogenase subunit 2